MKKYDVITALDLCVDFIVNCGDVVPQYGQTEQLVNDYNLEIGGSTVIFACQAAKLGLKVAGVGRIGKDRFGEFIIEGLKSQGVNTDLIEVSGDIKTGMGLALTKGDRDRAILTYTGSIDAATPDRFTDDLIKSARHIHVGSYFLMNKLRPHYPGILKAAKAEGLSVSFDSNWDPANNWDNGIMNVMPYVDVFLPNMNEVRYISKIEDKEKAIDYLRKQVKMLVIKNGPDGATAFFDENSVSQEAIDAVVVDTIGAGDSFDAGFVYGTLQGYDIKTSLKIGCATGSKSTEKPGGISGQINSKQLAELMK